MSKFFCNKLHDDNLEMEITYLREVRDIVDILLEYVGQGPLIAAEQIRRARANVNAPNAVLAEIALTAVGIRLGHVKNPMEPYK